MSLGFKQNKLPAFDAIDPLQVEKQIELKLSENKQQLTRLLQQPSPHTWQNLMQPMEKMNDELSQLWAPLSHLHGVRETEEVREVYNRLLPLLTDYHTFVSQNETLFKAIQSIAQSDAYAQLSAPQQKIIENDLRDFKLAGIHLSPELKAQFAELQQKMSQLSTKFSENVLDATQAFSLPIDEKEANDLPPQALALAIENGKKHLGKGFALTLDFPSYSTAMRFLKNRQIREQLYLAYTTRASDSGPHAHQWDNLPIMEEMLAKRHEIANLVGFKNYAELSLATKMAHEPQEVLQFLDELVTKSKLVGLKEYRELKDFAQQLDGLTDFAPWDMPYYAEKLRESQFHFSPEDLRPYFPINKVLEGMFTIVNKLYGITIREQSNISVWHPDVQFFSIYNQHNELCAGFYTDLYARALKRDGAWMDECRTRHRSENELILPVAFLTCNFMPPVADQPALLSHDEVLTLFHEFGHCLHHMLTQIDFSPVSGINGVPWDTVEFPSQFMEFFCWEKEALHLLSGHYQTREPIPAALYEKMVAAKHFQTGLQTLRQLEFALFDFRLHLNYTPAQAPMVMKVLKATREQVAVAPVPASNRFANSFSHIFGGGYAAGYYSYKWAEVLSADAYAKFEENGIFDAATGQSFLNEILAVGGSKDPMTAFIAFRGRKPSIDALLKHTGLTTH